MTKKRILIVEDEIDIRELVALYLENSGYLVSIAGDGEEALAITRRELPQLILLDIEMPRMDGYEFCRRIRADHAVPIIFLSSHRGISDKIRCFELGGDDYITKPFDFRELKARIEANLRRYQIVESSAHRDKTTKIQIRDLVVDMQRYQFFIRGKPIELSTKEAQLLMLFVRYPNRVWNADQLYDHVWGLESTGNIDTVKVHISNLRRKLESDPARPQYIQTIRGIGYIFVK